MGNRTLIIGASGEIGKSIVQNLLREGHSLYLHYHSNVHPINEIKMESLSSEVLDVFQADLSNPAGLQAFLKVIPNDIDHIVFASGNGSYGLFQDMDDISMDQLIHLHVTAPWKITKSVLPTMIRKQIGHILFITSIWGEVGASCEVAYSAVKGSQHSFIKALAKEVAPSGIHVNGVSPGMISTKMNAHLTKEDLQLIEEDIPMQRSGRSEEVANVVSFLLSDKASYINGEIIRVNGAWY